MPADAHHRHTYFYHWAGFPTVITVYNCSANAATLQTAIANWNANGGLGTIFTYGGNGICSPATGIYAVHDAGLAGTSGQFRQKQATIQSHEVLKDATQLGRVRYQGITGQFKLTRAELAVSTAALTNVNVYAHELGHAVGLHEHYVDVTGISCVTYPVATIMDCPDAHTGPQSHDAGDATTRYNGNPWGPGAVWISSDTGTSLTLNWADINDNETAYEVYKDGALIATKSPDTESHFVPGLTPGAQNCFYVKVRRGAWSGFGAQICRQWNFSAPVSPSGLTILSVGNNYTKTLRWTTNDTQSYTHEWVVAYNASGGYPVIATYYIPHHGTGQYSFSFTLGRYDPLPATYYIEVYTCSAKYNPYNGLGCSAPISGTVYMAP